MRKINKKYVAHYCAILYDPPKSKKSGQLNAVILARYKIGN